MDKRELELANRLLEASKEAARKAVRGQQGVSPQVIDGLTSDIMLAWIEKNTVFQPADPESLLSLAREKGLLSEERKEREVVSLGREGDLGTKLERLDQRSLAGVSTDPMTRCVSLPDNNPVLAGLKAGNSSEQMYYTLYRLHEGQFLFQGQPAAISRRVRYTSDPSLPPEWCTTAYKDLLIYHLRKEKGSPCPTCKRIARFIRGVSQGDVERTINALIVDIRLEAQKR